jgi:UDP-glucose 4-epimerase
MTKALMERIMIAASREKRGKTVLCGTRYGNVMYTRGSVIPYFINQIKEGKKLTVTNKDMTRFMMSLDDSIDLVLHALTNGKNGEIYVRKASSSTVGDLAESLADIFKHKKGIKEIGSRPGEKMHETLISKEEAFRAEDCGKYYKINPEVSGMDYRKYYFEGKGNGLNLKEGYTSANTKRLSKNETKKLLLSLKEVKEELKNWEKKS